MQFDLITAYYLLLEIASQTLSGVDNNQLPQLLSSRRFPAVRFNTTDRSNIITWQKFLHWQGHLFVISLT
jgi:hypothetical protein